MTAYYNENHPFTAQWLRNLIAEGLLPTGEVDERSVVEVRPGDLGGFTQCHFFAGIGGWALALKLAGWPRNATSRVWTISCPCPPWSRVKIHQYQSIGRHDYRDLWPVMVPLIRACRPCHIYGEQVAGKRAIKWHQRTIRNLLVLDYNVIDEIREAHIYGSPQRRERFYFTANLGGTRRPRLVAGGDIGAARPFRWRGEEDMCAIVKAPFKSNHRWPKPLVRLCDDGLPTRMGRLRAYGNAIDPWVAAQFVSETNGGLNAVHFNQNIRA